METIPSELTNLSGLEDYWSDVFTIGVPSEDSGLVYLYLSDNELIGEIPLGLGTLPNLQHLSPLGQPAHRSDPVGTWRPSQAPEAVPFR